VFQSMEYHWTTKVRKNTFYFFVFQSVSRANTVNMNAPPLVRGQLFVSEHGCIQCWWRIFNRWIRVLAPVCWYYQTVACTLFSRSPSLPRMPVQCW
jgi:hypothetical protein